VDGLKHNNLSVGNLVDKGYQLQFIEKNCIIKEKNDTLISSSKRKRGNAFHLNSTKITSLVSKVDDSWLWHRYLFISTFIIVLRSLLHL
jgi:maltodextrin utilization protein YvdJ